MAEHRVWVGLGWEISMVVTPATAMPALGENERGHGKKAVALYGTFVLSHHVSPPRKYAY